MNIREVFQFVVFFILVITCCRYLKHRNQGKELFRSWYINDRMLQLNIGILHYFVSIIFFDSMQISICKNQQFELLRFLGFPFCFLFKNLLCSVPVVQNLQCNNYINGRGDNKCQNHDLKIPINHVIEIATGGHDFYLISAKLLYENTIQNLPGPLFLE